MSRPSGTKNIMRTPEEKAKLILEFMSSNMTRVLFYKEKNISRRLFTKWCYKYEKDGIERLTSKTGTKKGINKGKHKKTKTREEELFIDFNLKESNDVEKTIKDYVLYFNNDRPAYSLKYKTPTQFKTELELNCVFL